MYRSIINKQFQEDGTQMPYMVYEHFVFTV